MNRALLLMILCVPMFIGCERIKDPDEAAEPEVEDVTAVGNALVFDAERRRAAGIETTSVSIQKMADTSRRIGWLIAPPASETVIRSPVAGFVAPHSTQSWPQLGQIVDGKTSQAQINVFLTPQEVSQLVLAKEDNDIQMQQALVTMELSEAQLKLVTTAGDAVTGVRVDQLREAYERSKAAYKESQEKLPFLIQEPYDNGVVLKPIPVPTSTSGKNLQLHISQGQFVQAGDPLWTVGDWTTLWVRVPVFSGEFSDLQTTSLATVEIPGEAKSVQAERMSIPSSANPDTRTVDLLFSLSNTEWKFRPGQAVTVNLSSGGDAEVLVIPKSALVYDSFGQAYCFATQAGSDTFERRRLELGPSVASEISVLRGIDSDDIVVSLGAEQLAAEESKSELAVEDDD